MSIVVNNGRFTRQSASQHGYTVLLYYAPTTDDWHVEMVRGFEPVVKVAGLREESAKVLYDTWSGDMVETIAKLALGLLDPMDALADPAARQGQP